MPSQDEQSIWEELQQFPDQNFTWERRQVILQNIREKRRKLQRLENGKKYVGWVTSGMLTCAVLFAFFWMKPFSSSVETTVGSHAVIDQKYITAAQKEIQALGITKEFLFEEMEEDPEYVVVRTKNREALVYFNPKSTEVRTVSATLAIKELPSIYQKYEETARQVSKEANPDLLFQTVNIFKGREGTFLSFEAGGDDRQYVKVELNTNKVDDFNLYYNPGDVDKKAVLKAQQALSLLSNRTGFPFTRAEKSSDPRKQEEVWTLTNASGNELKPGTYTVEIGAETNQIYTVKYVTDQYKIKSIDEVIPVTKPLIKSIFGIDTTGYKAYGGRSWGGYLLKREGSPTITISIWDLNMGNVDSISIEE